MELKETSNHAQKIISNEWVQWVHLNTFPSVNQATRLMNVALGYTTKHCAKCRNLNGCCFSLTNVPNYPLHENCHCVIINAPYVTVTCDCSISKFLGYIFDLIKNAGKKILFESWGYTSLDSKYLKTEFERQASLKYSCGDYILGMTNDFGHRISIEIVLLNKKTGENINFYSGWMVYSNGKLVLTTPYGGIVK